MHSGEINTNLIFSIIAILLVLSVFSSKLSERFNVPGLLLFLAIGMLAGHDGIGKIDLENPYIPNITGIVALAFILFSGGLDTNWKAIRPIVGYGISLATLGVLITATLVGTFAHYVLNFSLIEGLLLGAIVSSTDAAAVFSILRSKSVGLKRKLQPMLELESGSNDPMAVFLTIFIIGMLSTPQGSYLGILPVFFLKMPIGAIIGILLGKALPWLFNRIKLNFDGLYHVLGIATVMFTYGASEMIGGNGFLAVYVCGIMIGNSNFFYKHSLTKFHDGISWLMQISMFIILGLMVYPSKLPTLEVILPGLTLALFLMLVARPLAVFISLLGSEFDYRERIFISWVGLRGAAPIVLATFPMLAGYKGSERIFNLVFFIVISSILIQGKTLMFAARKLKLNKTVVPKPRSPLEFERTDAINSDMIEVDIVQESPANGKKISELSLPADSLVVLIRRNQQFVVPKGNSLIESGDCLLVLAEAPVVEQVIAALNPAAPPRQ
jgi:cell volume regulation protein A